MSDVTKSIELSNITNMFRLPKLSNASQVRWVHSTPVCKTLERFGDQSLPSILTTLLQRLSQISVTANQVPENRQIILTCHAFAASTIFANFYSLKSTWQQLNFYHRSANIEFADLFQIGMVILSEPYKQEHPLHLFHGFDLQQCSQANWNLPTTDFRLGRHPLQLYIKKKFMLLLTDRIRQYDGAKDFKRTNNGLLKKTSQLKMREALNQMGNTQIPTMLVLHKVLIDAKDFYTPQPQAADYQRLHDACQAALIVKNMPACSLQTTQEHLAQLGSSIRSYGNSNMRSLNEEVGEYGSELLDRFSNHQYSDPLENCLKLEHQKQAEDLKRQVHQQLTNLPPAQKESFWLKACGHNDSQIAKLQSIGASSTVKRRRDNTISKVLNIPIDKNFSTIADLYIEIAHEFFVVNTN